MLEKVMMQEIIDMKEQGYSIREIMEYYKGLNGKAPSLPTIRKYYAMDVLQENPREKLAKDKVFDVAPWKEAILEILENNPSGCHRSSIYDVLAEHFIENGDYEELPGTERTLRSYVNYLSRSGQIPVAEEHGRIYDHVFDTPPGQQMLLDFGEQRIKQGLSIHFICMLLRYSRTICVFAQDHKFNAEEACRAIYMGFCKLGGRPLELVIDQDTVFVTSELYGEITQSRVFKAFTAEQELRLWVCNKSDPESKGGIENVVGFVKKNFFSARKITCMEDVWRSLPGWVERKNKRIHQATFRVPMEVFAQVERAELRPLLPSVYETMPTSFASTYVGDKLYIQYRSSKYSVPRKFSFKTIYYKAIGDKLHIYGPDLKYECTHDICPCKGSAVKLPEHTKDADEDWLVIQERLRSKWNCYDFQHFINGFKKENGSRHIRKQLKAVEAFLDVQKPEKDFVAGVMAECCRDFQYRFSQFKAVYERSVAARQSHSQAVSVPMGSVQQVGIEMYQQAFLERCSE
jgi:hypothetical protein